MLARSLSVAGVPSVLSTSFAAGGHSLPYLAPHSVVNFPVRVRDSPIHGRGVFAARALAPGEALLAIDPEAFAQGKRHPWNRKNRDILPFFLNHACEPNAFLRFLPECAAVAVVAARLIRADEEITLDYALVELGGRLLPCTCGSPRCRGAFPANLP